MGVVILPNVYVILSFQLVMKIRIMNEIFNIPFYTKCSKFGAGHLNSVELHFKR